METFIKDYGLKFYVRDLYVKNAAKRGGEVFQLFNKKDVRPFQIRIRYAIDRTQKVIGILNKKYPLCNN